MINMAAETSCETLYMLTITVADSGISTIHISSKIVLWIICYCLHSVGKLQHLERKPYYFCLDVMLELDKEFENVDSFGGGGGG